MCLHACAWCNSHVVVITLVTHELVMGVVFVFSFSNLCLCCTLGCWLRSRFALGVAGVGARTAAVDKAAAAIHSVFHKDTRLLNHPSGENRASEGLPGASGAHRATDVSSDAGGKKNRGPPRVPSMCEKSHMESPVPAAPWRGGRWGLHVLCLHTYEALPEAPGRPPEA
jgi:hypothetical protein